MKLYSSSQFDSLSASPNFVMFKIFNESKNFCQLHFAIEAKDPPGFDWFPETYFEITIDVHINNMNETVIICYFASVL